MKNSDPNINFYCFRLITLSCELECYLFFRFRLKRFLNFSVLKFLLGNWRHKLEECFVFLLRQKKKNDRQGPNLNKSTNPLKTETTCHFLAKINLQWSWEADRIATCVINTFFFRLAPLHGDGLKFPDAAFYGGGKLKTFEVQRPRNQFNAS